MPSAGWKEVVLPKSLKVLENAETGFSLKLLIGSIKATQRF